MYSDVAYQTTPTKMNLSIFRSQPYFQQIEKLMESLTEWAVADEGIYTYIYIYIYIYMYKYLYINMYIYKYV
jgi:hypothetical protein